jgi:hypothetical protein
LCTSRCICSAVIYFSGYDGIESEFATEGSTGLKEEQIMAKMPAAAEQTGQHAEAVQHIAEAHRILNKLREEADKHPAPREAMAEAIQKLELALAILSVKTGGML